jgi:hypothetical protein
MEKKKDNRKIVLIAFICIPLISILIYFVFISPNTNFNFRDIRMRDFQITSEIENEITSFFDSSPSDLEINNYCLENPMYCGYYCRENDAEFCEDFKFGGMPHETGKFNYSR